MYPVIGVSTLGADHEKVTFLSSAIAWKSSKPSGKSYIETFFSYSTNVEKCFQFKEIKILILLLKIFRESEVYKIEFSVVFQSIVKALI